MIPINDAFTNNFYVAFTMIIMIQNKMNVGVSQRDFQDIIREHRSKLERVFRRYCGGGKMAPRSKIKSNKRPHDVGTLSMMGFYDILVSAGCVASRSSKDQDKKQRRGGKKTNSNKRNKKRTDDSSSSSSSKRSRINRLVQSAFLSAVYGRPVRYVDIMKQRRSVESGSCASAGGENDERDDDTVLNELTFSEFLEALYEFTVLKVRASILSKKSAEDDTKNDDDDHHVDDDDDDGHDSAPHQTLEKFIEVAKSIVAMLK